MKSTFSLKNMAGYFLFIFFGSLTNSIFVNQLGYYGALFFLLVIWYKTKDNPFEKTGLELALILYLVAEILALIFTENKPQALQNLMKRAFLMPIIFVVPPLMSKEKINKQLIWLSAFAMIGVFIYLYKSYSLYALGEMQRNESGPSVFQYPITASEIMTFFMLFYFALILEKGKHTKRRIVSIVLFILTALAIFATYKKTGWIGSAAGIFIIIFCLRKWIVNILLLSSIVVGFLLSHNSSKVSLFSISESGAKQSTTVTTSGSALSVNFGKKIIAVSDYSNGVLLYNDSLKLIQHITTPAPAGATEFIGDSLLMIYMLNTKLLLYTNNAGVFSETGKEFLSPGLTVNWKIYNSKLYVLDRDSGLTVFALSGEKKERFPSLSGFENFEVLSDSLLICAAKSKVFLTSYSSIKDSILVNKQPSIIYKIGDGFILGFDDNISAYDVHDSKICNVKNITLTNRILRSSVYGSEVFVYYSNNSWASLKFDSTLQAHESTISIINKGQPYSIAKNDSIAIVTEVKRSPLLRIFDSNHPSNSSRIALWKAGFAMFMDHPLTGVGDIDLAKQYIKYKSPTDKEIQGHLHNNFMHILATLGVFGIIAYLYLLFSLYKLYFSVYNLSEGDSLNSALMLGAIGSLTSFIFAGLTEWNFGDHEIITMVWLITGLALAIKTSYKTDNN